MDSSQMVTPVSISIDCWLSVICREVWANRAKQESKNNLKRMKWLQTKARDKLGLKQEFRSQAADSGHHPKENVACGQLSPLSLTSKLSLSEVRRWTKEGDIAEQGQGSRACQILGVMELKLAVSLSTQDSLERYLQWALKYTLKRLLSISQEKSQKWDFQLYKRNLSVKPNYQTLVLCRLLPICSFKRCKYKAPKSSGTSAPSEGDHSSERVCTVAIEMVVKAWHRSQLGPHFTFFLLCPQAATFHGTRTQQHPRGPGMGTFRATHWSADRRLPDPPRESHRPDGPLQSRDRWAQSPSPA